jgi:hypothetical protein
MKHYLDKYQGDIICPLQIWYEALGGYGAPTPADMNAMGAVLDGLDKWKPVGETRYEKFGKQPSYSRA